MERSFKELLEQKTAETEAAVYAYLPEEKGFQKTIFEAMNYSVKAGGKRLRPLLMMETYRMLGGKGKEILPFMAAIEMIHTSSLIHDDLPCMDDDDLRRGKPTNHKVYGETLAVLAGDALQPEAFRLILQARGLSADNRIEAALLLAKACGADGMVAGQVLDTLCHVEDEEGLTGLNRLKTGVMISAAAELGCVASNMPAYWRQQAVKYADQLGLAFQIRDDMLDVMGDEAVFGKPIGSDKDEGKITYVNLKGLDGCAQEVEKCTVAAKEAIRDIPDHDFLWELADRMVGRNK